MLEYDRKKLGTFLRGAREKANLTQMEISSRLGYSSPLFISNIERGVSVAPLALLSKLVSAYKISPDPVIKIILESQSQMLRTKLSGKKASRK